MKKELFYIAAIEGFIQVLLIDIVINYILSAYYNVDWYKYIVNMACGTAILAKVINFIVVRWFKYENCYLKYILRRLIFCFINIICFLLLHIEYGFFWMNIRAVDIADGIMIMFFVKIYVCVAILLDIVNCLVIYRRMR